MWTSRTLRKKRLSAVVGLVIVVGVISFSAVGSAAGTDGFTATALTPDSTFSASKSDSGQLAQTDPSLLNRSDATPVDVMIKYDYDATASYTGGVHGLAPTSPAVTGTPLDQGSSAITAYNNYTEARANQISAAVEQAVPAATVGDPVNTVYGGVPAVVPANSVDQLLQVPGVAAVQQDTLNQPQDDNTSFIGATNVWPALGGSDTAASNVIVGVIDTGVWPEHPMLVAKPNEPARLSRGDPAIVRGGSTPATSATPTDISGRSSGTRRPRTPRSDHRRHALALTGPRCLPQLRVSSEFRTSGHAPTG